MAMETQNFENELTEMKKSEVTRSENRDILPDAISNAKDKSVLCWWWLTIPLYIIIMFLMKSIYMKHSTLISILHEFSGREKIFSVVFFLIIPLVFIIMNFFSIRKIYFLSGNPKIMNFLWEVWFNVLIIIFSLLILLIYSL